MLDEWTKKQLDGRTVFYTSDIAPEAGGIIRAHLGDVAITQKVYLSMTHQEVEDLLAPTLQGLESRPVRSDGSLSNLPHLA